MAGAGINLRVSEDGMAMLLDCPVVGEDVSALASKIDAELRARRVAEPPGLEELEGKVREAAEQGGRVSGVVIARGVEPKLPKDGAIEWAGNFFDSGFVVDPKTGAIDYWRRSAQVCVGQGQLLAKATNPEEGRDGRDVFGKKVPAPRAKRARMRGGANVQVEEKADATYYYAGAEGRVRWMGDTVSVDRVYTVAGSVGLKTGYIDHPGALVVNQDVLEGSKVKTGGEIEVKGTVEASDITSGGGLTVRGGITGGEGKKITAKGDVHAKFILNADVEASGNIVVEKMIMNSKVKAHGAVIITEGRVVGGEVIGLTGIIAGQAGSEGSVPTLLLAGALEPPCRGRTCDPGKNKLPENAEGEQEARPEGEETKVRAETERAPKIVIKKKLYPETTLAIRGAWLRVGEALLGPLRAVLRGGEVELESSSD